MQTRLVFVGHKDYVNMLGGTGFSRLPIFHHWSRKHHSFIQKEIDRHWLSEKWTSIVKFIYEEHQHARPVNDSFSMIHCGIMNDDPHPHSTSSHTHYDVPPESICHSERSCKKNHIEQRFRLELLWYASATFSSASVAITQSHILTVSEEWSLWKRECNEKPVILCPMQSNTAPRE